MKYAAVLLVAASAACAEEAPRTNELRQVLQQVQPAGTAPPPRQLTPAEREQLRKQLAEFAQPRGKK